MKGAATSAQRQGQREVEARVEMCKKEQDMISTQRSVCCECGQRECRAHSLCFHIGYHFSFAIVSWLFIRPKGKNFSVSSN